VNPAHIAAASDWYERITGIGPSPEPCLCGAPITTHSGNRNRGGNPTTGCLRYRKDVAYDLAVEAHRAQYVTHAQIINEWQQADYPRPEPTEGGSSVGPSDIGTCRRAIQYRELIRMGKLDIDLDPVDESAAAIGNLIHDAYGRARKRRFPHRLYEFPVHIPGLDRPGRMDEYDPISGEGVDYKTMGERAWEWLGDFGPKEEFWKQLAIYLLGVHLDDRIPGRPRTMRIIAIRRSDGDVEGEFTRPWDEAYARKALGELMSINVQLKWGEDLPRDGSGPTKDPICRDWCRFKSHCWDVKAAAAAGRSPESYVFLGADTDDGEVEFAAETVHGWKVAHRDAERQYKTTKTWLEGIPDGDYGIYTVTARTREMPDYKLWRQRVLDAAQAGATAAEAIAIPIPKRLDAWAEVGLVRASRRKTKPPAAPQPDGATP
jgi:hypothetical protein